MVSLVAALDESGVIGRGGDLPWRLPDDQRFFRRLTTGHCIVMGRRTFDSIGRPLPRRTSIVVSRDPHFAHGGVLVARSPDAALALAAERGESECFVIGGADLYAALLPRCDRLYLTRVEARVEGDTHFPELDWSQWKRVGATRHEPDERHAHAFRIEEWERRASPAR